MISTRTAIAAAGLLTVLSAIAACSSAAPAAVATPAQRPAVPDGPAWSDSEAACMAAAWVIEGAGKSPAAFPVVYLDAQGHLVNGPRYRDASGAPQASVQIATGPGADHTVYTAMVAETPDAQQYLMSAAQQLATVTPSNNSPALAAQSICSYAVPAS